MSLNATNRFERLARERRSRMHNRWQAHKRRWIRFPKSMHKLHLYQRWSEFYFFSKIFDVSNQIFILSATMCFSSNHRLCPTGPRMASGCDSARRRVQRSMRSGAPKHKLERHRRLASTSTASASLKAIAQLHLPRIQIPRPHAVRRIRSSSSTNNQKRILIQ